MPKPRKFVSKKAIDNARLFKRVSQIFGIPVKDLKPIFLGEPTRGLSDGHYHPATHTFSLSSTLSYQSRRDIQSHEERHAVQNLLGLEKTDLLHAMALRSELSDRQKIAVISKLQRIHQADLKFVEFTDPMNERNLGSVLRITRAVGAKKILPATLAHLVLSVVYLKVAFLQSRAQLFFLPSFLAPSFISAALSDRKFRSVFRNHGEDGLILLWANPPRGKTGTPAIKFGNWEKRMIENGYLLERGGFTKKGLRFLREKVRGDLIQQRLHRMKTYRKLLRQ